VISDERWIWRLAVGGIVEFFNDNIVSMLEGG